MYKKKHSITALKMRRKTMSKLDKQQAKNALGRIKAALRADNENQAITLVQQIFEAGFQHGVNSIFDGSPEDEEII